MTTPLARRATTPTRSTTYGARIRAVLVVAMTLSATHTVYSYVAGLGDPRFTVTTPVAYAFYAVGFAAAHLALREARWAQLTMLAYLALALLVAIFVYPTTFVPRQQTVFGWFENDVYTGLLMVATYLGIERLRKVRLADGRIR